MTIYRIRPNYCTCSYKRTVKQFGSLYKNICCWYSFELPQQVEAIQMSTNNIWFYKETNKKIAQVSLNTPLMKFSADLFFFEVYPY